LLTLTDALPSLLVLLPLLVGLVSGADVDAITEPRDDDDDDDVIPDGIANAGGDEPVPPCFNTGLEVVGCLCPLSLSDRLLELPPPDDDADCWDVRRSI
jgi:hypothetical protein